jgi:hypothetical protein
MPRGLAILGQVLTAVVLALVGLMLLRRTRRLPETTP